MKIIINATVLRFYPVGKPGFTGGTEHMVRMLAKGLAGRGHTVHVITPDLEREEQRAPTEWWWPQTYGPSEADAVVAIHNLETTGPDSNFRAPLLVCATNGVDPFLGPEGEWGKSVDAWPCFSQSHIDLLTKIRPTVDKTKCHITGLGVDLEDYPDPSVGREPVPGRMIYLNDPARGLFHVLDIYELVRATIPDASLHVTYDFDRQFAQHQWESNYLSEMLWECRRRMKTLPNVVNCGRLSREDVILQQLDAQIHVMPSEPPNIGSQIHGIAQMECAAAGVPLILSDTEAFPEVFGDGALILPTPGTFLPQIQRRYDAGDWAEAVIQMMSDPEKWTEAARIARSLAERNTWEKVVDRWEAMLADLTAALGLENAA